ncbi:MAG: VWA domain-containing protein [Candidatus Acidiferrales bacterium]
MARIIPLQGLIRSRSCFLFSAGLLFCGVAAFSQAPPSPPAPTGAPASSTISVETELVALPVSVTGADGSFVSGLSLQDFRVYEDKRLQKITMFQQGDAPVTVGLIVDHSRSMGPKLPEVIAAVAGFARSSNPQDEMFVVDFNDDVSVELLGGKPFTSDPREMGNAVGAVSARGRTALYDAVAEGLLHLRLGTCERKALIIVSDGGDNASQYKLSQVLALAQQSQVLIYSIGLISDTGEVDPDVLRRLSKDTGGVAYFPDAAHNVAIISAQIARDLREQYTLGFTPEKATRVNAFRRIEVKVTAPGHGRIHVRTRAGYFAAAGESSPAQPAKGAL